MRRRLICRIIFLLIVAVNLMGFVSITKEEIKINMRSNKICKKVKEAHTKINKEKKKTTSKIDTKKKEPAYYLWTVESTAYTHTGNPCASGVYPYVGCIAAPPGIAFGTKVYVPGYGYATVEDRGGAIYGDIIDLFFNSVDECNQWGRRVVTIKVYIK